MRVGRADVKQGVFLISSLYGGDLLALCTGRFKFLQDSVRYPLARRLLELQSHSGRGCEENATRTFRLGEAVRTTSRNETVASNVQTRRKSVGTYVSCNCGGANYFLIVMLTQVQLRHQQH
jgi:hypothetical protein